MISNVCSSSNQSLKRHVIRIHRKIQDFICWAEGCSASYGYHSSLKKHIAQKHPEIDLTGLKIAPDPNAKARQMKEGDLILIKSGVKKN